MARRRYHKFKKFRPRKYTLFQRFTYFCRKHPLISSVGSIIVSVILFRAFLSNKLFNNNITEFRIWIVIASFIFFIIGITAILVWMRRNVPDFHSKHDVRWRSR